MTDIDPSPCKTCPKSGNCTARISGDSNRCMVFDEWARVSWRKLRAALRPQKMDRQGGNPGQSETNTFTHSIPQNPEKIKEAPYEA